jgi:transposase-like protein
MLSAIGEAIRSLIEDEAHLLTFYEFPASIHRHIQTTNAIESRLLPRATAHRSD